MPSEEVERWVSAFHSGDAVVLEACYRNHFDDVHRAVRRVLRGADCETVVHQVFCRLLGERRLREGFRGGNLAAWLDRVARNDAIDFARRYGREQQLDSGSEQTAVLPRPEEEIDAKNFLRRFVDERLPEKLRGVFEARFVQQLSQREAADKLGMNRTTLVYQEQQVRSALRAYASTLEEEGSER